MHLIRIGPPHRGCQPPMVSGSQIPRPEPDKQQQVRLIMVAPLWGHPTILGMLEDYPCVLLARQDLVILPTPQDKFIMKQGIPDLVAWPISGNHSLHEGFLQKLQTSSWRTKIKPTMILCLPNGLIGVSKGIEIPLLVL